MPDALPSGTVTFLFTDVEGSTRLLHELGAEAYAAALAEHRRVVREACARHGGVEVDTQGDAFFFAFPTAPGALSAAGEMTEALAAGPIRIRVGLHTGTPLLTEEGYVGTDIHRAARIAAAGHGGQVLVSAASAALTGTAVLTDLGEHRFKDLSAPERVYQLGGGAFPALKSLYRTNLPIPATPFLGRETELAEVLALLSAEDTRLLTLTGPGGIGKTRLALQAAAEAADAYPDGVWWIRLAPLRDPALVLEAAAQVLGSKNGLAEHIADKRMLCLFDNFEHVVEAAPELGALAAACPGLDLVVTSRERLRIRGEQAYPVPPLAEREGEALFVARARAVDPSFEPSAAVSEICARLDELPLALELAAARTALFSPGQLLERLSHRLDLLKGERDADPRQQTLRATIEWSHDLLGRAEQALFARLSVFGGGCTLEAAEEVCEADLDVMQSLIDKSLLRRRDTELGPRYWMLETIRVFARERLDGSGEADAVSGRHAGWCAALAEASQRELTGIDQAQWWRRLTEEQDNLRAALEWTCRQDPALALRLAGDLSRYWWNRGHYREGRRWYEAVLVRADEASPTLRARAVYGLATMLMGSGDAPRAIALLEECLAVFEAEGDRRRAQGVRTDLGIACQIDGRNEEARSYFEEAREMARADGDPRAAGAACINLATLLLATGEVELAEPLLEEALNTLRAVGDDQSAGNALGNLAHVALRRGDLDGASSRLREAIRLSRLTDDRYALAHALVTAGAVASARGDARGGAFILGRSAALQEEMDLALDVIEKGLYEDLLAELRATLGADEFQGAWDESRACGDDEAWERIASALGSGPATSPG